MTFEDYVDTMYKLLGGLPLTMTLVIYVVVIGAVLGAFLAYVRIVQVPVLQQFASAYVFAIRGTPLLVQLFFLSYGISQFEGVRNGFLWPVLVNPFWCGVLALSLNTAAYVSEIVRGGYQAIPKGMIEAAQATGMSSLQVLRTTIAPLAIKHGLPAYGNEVILMVKATSLVSTITLLEVTGIARSVVANTYRVFEVLGMAGLIYLIINSMIAYAIFAIERRI